MKKSVKALLLVLCAVVLVCATVFATLAYMTSTSNAVTNTFTVGNITITMDEAPVDTDGKETAGDRVMANTYKLVAGKEYAKDPTIHVADGSDESYLFVKIDNQIASVINDLVLTDWTKVEGYTDLWKYDSTVTEEQDIVVFDGFTVKSTADNTALNAVANKKITLTAFAIQADQVTPEIATTEAATTLVATPAA